MNNVNDIYRITPIFEERIWGGKLLKEIFHYETAMESIAQVYHVIAIPGHLDCEVEGTGLTLSEFYKHNLEYFDCNAPEMPVRLATGCLDGKMSVHLHPEDDYALAHENMRGKLEGVTLLADEDDETECSIYLGHNAKTREEFMALYEKGDWENLLRKVTYKANDFLYYPYNSLHAESGDGTRIGIAFTTNGDVSYRFYDYGRNDPKRPLSVEKVLENVKIPDTEGGPVDFTTEVHEGYKLFNYMEIPKEFVAKRINVRGKGYYSYDSFMFILCGRGNGKIAELSVKPGETLLIPAHYGQLKLEGDMDLYILSYID